MPRWVLRDTAVLEEIDKKFAEKTK